MNFSLRVISTLLCFGIIRSENGNKIDSTLSKSGVHSSKNVPQSKNESELHVFDKGQCSQEVLSKFKHKSCNSSKEVLDKIDRLNCHLINDIADDVCAEHILNLDSYFQPTSPDCQKNYHWKPTSGPTIFLFLTGWNSICEIICNNEQIKGICEFIVNYYADPKVLNEAQPLLNNSESGAKSVKMNVVEDPDTQDVDTVPEENVDKIPIEDEQKTKEEPVQNPGKARKGVSDSSSSKKKDDPRKSGSSKDEQASNIVKNADIEKDPGDASLAKPDRIFPSAKNDNEGDSHIFFYFLLVSGMCIAFYFMMYKKKILALMIEGRRRNVKRRPNSAAYSKLDCNLEEAMSSGPSTSTSNTLMY